MLFFEKQGKLVCGWEERWQEPHAPYIKRCEYVIQRKNRIPIFSSAHNRNKERRFGIYSLPTSPATSEHHIVRHYKLASFIYAEKHTRLGTTKAINRGKNGISNYLEKNKRTWTIRLRLQLVQGSSNTSATTEIRKISWKNPV